MFFNLNTFCSTLNSWIGGLENSFFDATNRLIVFFVNYKKEFELLASCLQIIQIQIVKFFHQSDYFDKKTEWLGQIDYVMQGRKQINQKNALLFVIKLIIVQSFQILPRNFLWIGTFSTTDRHQTWISTWAILAYLSCNYTSTIWSCIS